MLSLFLSLTLAAASTDATSPQQPQESNETKPSKPKKICRSDGTTGSRLPTRICKTQEEWDAMSRNFGEDVRAKTSGGNGG